MPNRTADPLFQLIHSLQKSEKRNFKLYARRNSDAEDLKMITLFDALDKMGEYDEAALLQKAPAIKKLQLSNMKAHLYRQILASLRVLRSGDNIDLQVHEQLDNARLLYNKGLYLQSLKILDRLKDMVATYHQTGFMMQILLLEKQIESLHITRSMQDKADLLTAAAETAIRKLGAISRLSDLALQLYSWYIKHGHARNEGDAAQVHHFFESRLEMMADTDAGFYERLYLYQCHCWHAFIRQDFLMYYRYTRKWVALFDEEPQMLEVETAHYIKGMHNLLNAHFDLQNHRRFGEDLERFEQFARTPLALENDNNRIQTFVYLSLAHINRHFLQGLFKEGRDLVPQIEARLKEYALHLDRHRVLVFYYKFASLYFGSGDYGRAVDYLNRIINWNTDLRTDLQCYARLLHLIVHYELGNTEILEYLIKSVYRFMAKMEHLSVVEEEIFRFLRETFHLSYRKLKPEFEILLERLNRFKANRYEARAFSYLDIISWLESKISGQAVDAVIRAKYERIAGLRPDR